MQPNPAKKKSDRIDVFNVKLRWKKRLQVEKFEKFGENVEKLSHA